jgi:ribosomal protein S3
VPKAWISRRVGGDQIDYLVEKPEIRRLFASELAKHNIASRMDAAYAKEEAELGVKTA